MGRRGRGRETARAQSHRHFTLADGYPPMNSAADVVRVFTGRDVTEAEAWRAIRHLCDRFGDAFELGRPRVRAALVAYVRANLPD
jgi:hypothetical protein